jgi:hypothetical protein
MMSMATTAANAGCLAVIKRRTVISGRLAAMAALEVSWSFLRLAISGGSRVGAVDAVEAPDLGAMKSGQKQQVQNATKPR